MMWLTWRQFRVQATVAAVILVAAAVTLLVTGPRLANLYDSDGLNTCHAHRNCAAVAGTFLNQAQSAPYKQVYLLMILLMLVLPALILVYAVFAAVPFCPP